MLGAVFQAVCWLCSLI